MNLFAQSGWIKLLLIVFLLLLGAGSLVYNNYLVGKILDQERVSVELWAKAIEFNALPVHQQANAQLIDVAIALQQNPDVPDSLVEKLLEVESLRSSRDFVTDELILDEAGNFKVPAVLVDSNDVLLGYRNVEASKLKTQRDSIALVRNLKEFNTPVKIVIGDENTELAQFVYYGESPTVRLLRYFPYLQIVILSLLLGIGYTTYKSITRTEQSNLWVGMAKEAAHQLGTPISSLYGWIHLFKDEYGEDESASKLITEIENDVQRLSDVAERFGKIGSSPELNVIEIHPSLEEVVSYMERRLPKLGKGVEVRKSLNAEAKVSLNPELFQWAIENLVKNAMDALNKKDKNAFISISSEVKGSDVIIDIEDSGSGIELNQFKTVFRPGFSTKKRGWGLGLSLTKRIIEEYHSGKVFVFKSEPGNGTTMRIILKVQD
ncbi:MAG: HAMP domain-containing histidine kinase [Balneolaceae bacterium]|nr:HAMP domain-containing histidine kinase [Balneolaceae bacterium]MBO6545790.1 HAMP domain-containing histidine kinase [Balneolaceae bacterium]MBO6647186.1 HAMP domain-containing histidine kinase [Balneolaceae bacterium]